MRNVVVVGSQWGDEGKGKIVDWLSSEADVVVRFQGGHNAGHTLVIDKKVFKLRLLPSGIVRDGKVSILGNGVVIDPWALLDEIKEIKKQGIIVNSNKTILLLLYFAAIAPANFAHASICFCDKSTTVSLILGDWEAITAMVGPPT